MADGDVGGDDSNKHATNAATGNGLNADYSLWCQVYRLTDPDNKVPRHSQRANILWADGHVKIGPVFSTVLPPSAPAMEAALPFSTAIAPPGLTVNDCTA